MPKVTIWIRVEDWEAWQSIDDKPEFIHDAIQLKEMYKHKKLPVHFINPGHRGYEKIGTDSRPATAARITRPEPVVTEPEETA